VCDESTAPLALDPDVDFLPEKNGMPQVNVVVWARGETAETRHMRINEGIRVGDRETHRWVALFADHPD